MSKHTIYSTEERIVQTAESVLEQENDGKNPLFEPFSELLKNYKKMYKQFRRLVNLSDKQQLKLNQLNETLEVENYELVMELGQAFESFVRALTTTVDAKHPLTAGHSHRVTEFSLFLGGKLGIPEDELEVLKYTALLHDIGKIGVPDAVLTKNGRFTPEERLIMNEHAVWTYKILNNMVLPEMLKDIPKTAACHHEKLDGSGYPYGLKGRKIPTFSRIITVADVFDALTSVRDYPKYDGEKIMGFGAMPLKKAFSILEKDKETHFDPDIVQVTLDGSAELSELWKKFQDQ